MDRVSNAVVNQMRGVRNSLYNSDLRILGLTGFERFITEENYNVMKRSVTGCKHFRDPVIETEYNSFASQSDNSDLRILGLRPANERRRYKVTPSLIGWAQT